MHFTVIPLSMNDRKNEMRLTQNDGFRRHGHARVCITTDISPITRHRLKCLFCSTSSSGWALLQCTYAVCWLTLWHASHYYICCIMHSLLAGILSPSVHADSWISIRRTANAPVWQCQRWCASSSLYSPEKCHRKCEDLLYLLVVEVHAQSWMGL